MHEGCKCGLFQWLTTAWQLWTDQDKSRDCSKKMMAEAAPAQSIIWHVEVSHCMAIFRSSQSKTISLTPRGDFFLQWMAERKPACAFSEPKGESLTISNNRSRWRGVFRESPYLSGALPALPRFPGWIILLPKLSLSSFFKSTIKKEWFKPLLCSRPCHRTWG